MSKDIQSKLDAGDKLNKEEIAYASDHSIALPEEYGDAVRERQHVVDMGLHAGPVFQTGPAFASPQSPGLFLTAEQLEGLTKDALADLADAAGVEVSGTKAQMVATLAGTEEAAEEVEEDEG